MALKSKVRSVAVALKAFPSIWIRELSPDAGPKRVKVVPRLVIEIVQSRMLSSSSTPMVSSVVIESCTLPAPTAWFET